MCPQCVCENTENYQIKLTTKASKARPSEMTTTGNHIQREIIWTSIKMASGTRAQRRKGEEEPSGKKTDVLMARGLGQEEDATREQSCRQVAGCCLKVVKRRSPPQGSPFSHRPRTLILLALTFERSKAWAVGSWQRQPQATAYCLARVNG